MTAVKNFRFDAFLDGLAIKAPCIVVTNANITLAGEQTVNSVVVVEGDRVLVKDQTDLIENGIYLASTSKWQRTDDFEGNSAAVNGTLVLIAAAAAGDFFAPGFFATSFFATGFFAGGSGASAIALYSLSATNPVEIGVAALTFNLLTL